MLYDSKPFQLAKSYADINDEQHILYEFVRPTVMNENQLGLIELRFMFRHSRTTDQEAVVLVPSKSKGTF